FSMVLAIGIVVDDAIVVIENVERIMTEENLPPKEATRKAMGQITGAVIAITVVLAAVFVPSALQPGASGIIYKQFALTIAMAMGFSAFLALTFTPALCASFLKPEHHKKKNVVYRKFNQFFDWTTHTYTGHVDSAVSHAPRWLIGFLLVAILGGFLFTRLPGSFLPEEDQGYALAIIQLPPGATKQRTSEVMQEMRTILNKDSAFAGVLQVTGFSFIGSGENAGMAFIRLKDWADRDVTASEFIQRANGAMQQIHDARIFVANIPTVQGLGQFGGFDMYLQDRGGKGRVALTEARNTLLGKAAKDPLLTGVRPNALEEAPQLHLDVDRVQAQTMGLSLGDIYNAVGLMLAPVYVNDFTYGGRIKRVIMQADAPYRMGPDALNHVFTPSVRTNSDGTPQMIPLANVIHTRWEVSSPSLTRYNGYSAVEIVGSPAAGHSSGEAMTQMQNIVNNDLPKGFGFDWTGQSYQEILSGNAATLLMILSIVIVFLALAALYESWSIPVAVLLVVPLGLLGTVVFTLLRGLPDDIYFKIGLITVIGLAAKNAILIVEFAVAEQKAGRSLREATIDAARLRLRPILMTSLAFILGVFPLFISSGAGANARHAIGTGVIGGMLFATFLGVLLIPVFYVVVRRLLGDELDDDAPAPPQDTHAMQPFDSDPRRGV
ncbi:MAG: efflux RND transporter permease subunit, partial [Rhodanobacter sp.]